MWGDAMLRAQNRWAYTDLEPIGYINSDALIWVGSTEGPYKGMSVKQIVQAAKDKPNTVRIATVPGSMWDYIVDQVEANFGAKFLRVPFQGGGAGITALVGGNVDIAQGFYSEFRGHLEAGKVAPLGVAAPDRMDFLKDMPTMNEALGGNEYQWIIIRFAVVPKGTPADRKAYLGAAVQAAMKDRELIAEYKKAGVYFDGKLTNPATMLQNLNDYAVAREGILSEDRPAEVAAATVRVVPGPAGLGIVFFMSTAERARRRCLSIDPRLLVSISEAARCVWPNAGTNLNDRTPRSLPRCRASRRGDDGADRRSSSPSSRKSRGISSSSGSAERSAPPGAHGQACGAGQARGRRRALQRSRHARQADRTGHRMHRGGSARSRADRGAAETCPM